MEAQGWSGGLWFSWESVYNGKAQYRHSLPMGLNVACVAQELAVCQNAFNIPSLSRALTTRVEQACGISDFVWVSSAKSGQLLETFRDLSRSEIAKSIQPPARHVPLTIMTIIYCCLIDWINHWFWSDLNMFLAFQRWARLQHKLRHSSVYAAGKACWSSIPLFGIFSANRIQSW